jgi:hypothetical protein
VHQRFIYGVTFCQKFWEEETGHSIAAFRLTGEYQRSDFR